MKGNLSLSRTPHYVKFALYSVIFVSLLLGCASVPGTVLTERTSGDWLSLLPQDAFLYLTANLSPESRAGVKAVLGAEGGASTVIDRTDRLYAAVRAAQSGGGEITDPAAVENGLYAILMGNYPSTLAALSLSLDDEWTRRRIGRGRANVYWVAQPGDFKVSLPHRRVLLFSSEDIASLMSGYERGVDSRVHWPDGLLDVAGSAEILAYAPRFDALPLPMSAQVKAPLRETWAWLGRTRDRDFEVNTVFCLETAQDADRFTRAARLLVVFLLRGAEVKDLTGRLERVEVARIDEKVVLSGLVLTQGDLERLILYFRKGES